MQQIEVDFDVWKALTLRRLTETHSYNDVLRELLELPPPSPAEHVQEPSAEGRLLGGRFLPNGTRLRARYKDEWHYADIADDQLVGGDGTIFGSASAAARAVTGNNVNGLTFWEVRRPSDTEWRKILTLPRSRR